ncbi:MAG: DUF5057 domain-containing protein [Lachnospiraceae bacterium]|nr:DUF5057 domain-containing protein [Lachnospiraceae bacterium]
MKKAGKIFAYLLVLTLVTGLFAGLGYVKAPETDVKAASGDDFNVLEIVPNKEMATFFYFVDLDQNSTSDPQIGGNSLEKNCLTANFNNFLKTAGCGELDTSVSPAKFKSENLFVKKVLNNVDNTKNWNVKVTTRTPDTLDVKNDLKNVDLIIINETVPNALKISSISGAQSKTFKDNKFTTAQVLAIFKAIAGIGSDPIPYIIDYNVAHAEDFFDVRSVNETLTDASNRNQRGFSYIKANYVDSLTHEDTGATYLPKNPNMAPNKGSDQTCYKLYKLLTCINPATMYGLYMAYNDGSYGIDDNLNLYTLYSNNSGSTASFNLGWAIPGWTDEYIFPNFLTTSDGISIYSSPIASKLGWFTVNTGDTKSNSISDFSQLIGTENGNGIDYKNANGLFSFFPSSSGGGSTFTDVGDKVNVEIDPGSGKWSRSVKITNISGSTISNFKVSFKVKGLADVNIWTKPGGGDLKNSGTTFTATYTGSLTNNASITFGGQFDYTAPFVYSPISGDGAGDNDIATIVKNYKKGETKNDYHPYRFLVVTENKVDNTINRSLVADMIEYANSKNVGLAGGVVIDCMSRYQFDALTDDLDATYDGICVNGTLNSVGQSKYNAYSGLKPAFTAAALINAFETALDSSDTFGVNYTALPTEYYVPLQTIERMQNGGAGEAYMRIGDLDVANNANFINSDTHSGRTLDFDLVIKGSGSYKIILYVDVDHNDRFDSYEEKILQSGWSGNSRYKENVELDNILGKDFSGGFSWKLLIKSNSSGKTVNHIGYSALKSTTQQTIKILQIYPTDYKEKYALNNEMDENTGGTNVWSNAVLLLPTLDEMKDALNNHHGAPITSGDDSAVINNDFVYNYLDNVLTIDTYKTFGSGPVYVYDDEGHEYNDAAGKKYVVSAVNTEKVRNTGNSSDRRNSIIMNSSIFYYYMEMLKDNYLIDTTRYSVYGFNKAVDSCKIVLNKSTGKLCYGSTSPVKNMDGSNRYLYKATDLKLASDWKSKKVTWDEEELPKYLVDENTGRVFGYRLEKTAWDTTDEDNIIKVVYYDSQMKISDKDIYGSQAYELKEFDLLMVGFGENLDYMSKEAREMIEDYLQMNGPAFMGNGVLAKTPNNTLGKVIMDELGVTSVQTNDYDTKEQLEPTSMIINNTLFSHYPFNIKHYMRCTAGHIQPYKLNLSDPSVVVSYAKYSSMGSGKEWYKWGNAESCYYLYKKGSITFCGFGATRPEAQIGFQKGGIMSLAESILILNALITTSRSSTSPTNENPWFNCIDVDASVLELNVAGDDGTTPSDADKIYYLDDAVYTDYDSFGITKYGKSAELAFSTAGGSDAIESESLKPVGFTDSTTNVRWIPYEANLATNQAWIEFKTVGDSKPITVEVYKYNSSSKLYNKLTPVSNRYQIEQKGIYYIGIPLSADASVYNVGSSDKLGFRFDNTQSSKNIDQFKIRIDLMAKKGTNTTEVLCEQHTIVMVRRVLYPVK